MIEIFHLLDQLEDAHPDMVFRFRSSPNTKGWQVAEGWNRDNCEEGYCYFEARWAVEALEGLLEKLKQTT